MITITFDEYQDLVDSFGGICIRCQSEASGVEPDARGYTCDECGHDQVYGIEELLLMGEVDLVYNHRRGAV